LLLAGDRLDGGLKRFHMHETVHAVFPSEFRAAAFPMLLKSEGEGCWLCDIQGAIRGARQNVDEVGHRLRAIERTRRIGPCLRRDDSECASRFASYKDDSERASRFASGKDDSEPASRFAFYEGHTIKVERAQRETVAIVLKFLAQRCASASTEA
jgi:hypothetical protein